MVTTRASCRAVGKDEKTLIVLSEYLDLSLVKGSNLVMMQQCAHFCGMYLANAKGRSLLHFQGTITGHEASEILRITKDGGNAVDIAGRGYRFVRSLVSFEDRSAVTFQRL